MAGHRANGTERRPKSFPHGTSQRHHSPFEMTDTDCCKSYRSDPGLRTVVPENRYSNPYESAVCDLTTTENKTRS